VVLQAIASSRLKLVVLVGALWLFHASVANAQLSPTRYFEHDRALDGTPAEIVGGFFSLVAGAGTPDEQRYAVPDFLEFFDDNDNFTPPPYGGRTAYSWETREFTVAPAAKNGSFTVTMHWANPNVDFDLYVYRRNADGTVGPDPVASSAAGGTIQESATYVPDSVPDPEDPNSFDPGTVEPGTYVVYVDNWCSNENDPLDRELAEFVGEPVCLQGGYKDEDDWTANVTFAAADPVNKLPTAKIDGPREGTAGSTLTFTASGTDRDSSTDPPRFTYAFDLDGDGHFDYDSANNASVAKRFDTPGVYNIGVRVLDEDGGAGYAAIPVRINGVPQALPTGATPAKPTAVLTPLSSFTLGRPVFGGSNNRSLVVRYRLREASTVTVALYRGSRRIRTLSTGNRSANRSYRIVVPARNLRAGSYTIRLGAKTAAGRTQNARLSAKKL
jgi:hypothetical protein